MVHGKNDREGLQIAAQILQGGVHEGTDSRVHDAGELRAVQGVRPVKILLRVS